MQKCQISYAEAGKVVHAETSEEPRRAGIPGQIGMHVGGDVGSIIGENTRVDMRKIVRFITAAINCVVSE